jgi:hypothetical protein
MSESARDAAPDADVIDFLVDRDGVPTMVTLTDGTRLSVHNIAVGLRHRRRVRTHHDEHQPRVDGASIDFFFTSDIGSVSDPASGEFLA